MNYVTIKTYESTRRMLRLISAATGEQMVQVMERLCRDEFEKVLVSQAQVQINELPTTRGDAAERTRG